jgi:hypothetical protein
MLPIIKKFIPVTLLFYFIQLAAGIIHFHQTDITFQVQIDSVPENSTIFHSGSICLFDHFASSLFIEDKNDCTNELFFGEFINTSESGIYFPKTINSSSLLRAPPSGIRYI